MAQALCEAGALHAPNQGWASAGIAASATDSDCQWGRCMGGAAPLGTWHSARFAAHDIPPDGHPSSVTWRRARRACACRTARGRAIRRSRACLRARPLRAWPARPHAAPGAHGCVRAGTGAFLAIEARPLARIGRRGLPAAARCRTGEPAMPRRRAHVCTRLSTRRLRTRTQTCMHAPPRASLKISWSGLLAKNIEKALCRRAHAPTDGHHGTQRPTCKHSTARSTLRPSRTKTAIVYRPSS